MKSGVKKFWNSRACSAFFATPKILEFSRKQGVCVGIIVEGT